MAVSKRTRFEVLKRDNHTCRYCGAAAPDAKLTVDHVTPTALGGSDSPDNLVAACVDCNAGKASTSPDAAVVADVQQKAVEWSQAIAHFNQIRGQEKYARQEYVEEFREAWDGWRCGITTMNPQGDPFPLPSDWESSLWQFYATGLPIDEVVEAVQVACGHRTVHPEHAWRYMCGVIWRKVEQMHEGAQALLETDRGA